MSIIGDQDEFNKTFTPEIRDLLVGHISKGVGNACEKHSPEIGSNATTFGVDVYHFGWHELKKLAKLYPEKFRNTSSGNLYRLQVRDFEIACHRVRGDKTNNIYTSFPNNDDVAYRLVQEQLYFDGFEPKKYILAYFADPEIGLSGIYLCAPGRHENGKVVSWSVVHELWSAPDSATSVPPMKTAKVAPEKIPDFNLRTKKEKGKVEEVNE